MVSAPTKKPFSPNSAVPASTSLTGTESELKGSNYVVLADTDNFIVPQISLSVSI